MAYDWPVTLEDVHEALNLEDSDDDAELVGYIDAATEVIENVVGPVSATTVTEWHDGGTDLLILNSPVADLTTVTVSEYSGSTSQALAYEPLDGGTFTGYGFYAPDGTGASGILARSSSGTPTRFTTGSRVKVTYDAGRADVPANVRLAALKLIKHMWGDQRGSGEGRAVPGGAGDEYLAPMTSHLIPWEVEELLAPHRKAPTVA